MDVRQSPPRILYIATWIVVIGILGFLQWLIITPQPLLQTINPCSKLHSTLFSAASSLLVVYSITPGLQKLWARTMHQ